MERRPSISDPRFFTEPLYDVAYLDRHWVEAFNLVAKDLHKPHRHVFESDLKMTKTMVMDGDKPLEHHTHLVSLVPPESGPSRHEDNPYPGFVRRHSCFWDIAPSLIQDDWREAGIEHLTHWQVYFNDPARYLAHDRVKQYTGAGFRKTIESTYGPKPMPAGPGTDQRRQDINDLLSGIVPEYMAKAEKWVAKVGKDYDFPAFNGDNYDALAAHRWETELAETRAFLTDTIKRLTK